MIAALMLMLVWPGQNVPGQTVTIEGVGKDVRTGAPVVVQMDAIPTGLLVTMLLRDVMRVPYVIAPEVLADRRPTSVNLRMAPNDVPIGVVRYLRRAGFAVSLVGGTVYVSKGAPAVGLGGAPGQSAPVENGPQDQHQVFSMASPEIPSGSPLVSHRASPIGAVPYAGTRSRSGSEAAFGYSPAHRSPAFLATAMGPLLPGLVFSARSDVKADTEAGVIRPEQGPDLLMVAGTEAELSIARQMIAGLDQPRPMVAVRAIVVQIRDATSRSSALGFLLKIGGGNLEVGSFDSFTPGASQFVRLSTGALSAVLSASRDDSRFKIVATPNLVALSGQVSTMNAGASVPTLGNVTVTEGGAPVQSVVYRDSGITLTVRPIVRGKLIELDVREERSSFARTTTGVEASPTLSKSEVSASAVLLSGESILLAGLVEDSDTNTRAGLLGGLLGVRSREKSKTELVVLIEAQLVPSPASEGGKFLEFSTKEDGNDGSTTGSLDAAHRQQSVAPVGQRSGDQPEVAEGGASPARKRVPRSR